MDTMTAFAMGEANMGREMKVFDWDKAARIIKEKQPKTAHAGLAEDWEYTGGKIYEDGKIIKDDYTYLASTWATPVLILEYEEEIECYVMQSKTKYRHDTKWPKSAIDILKGAGDEQ